MPGLGSEVIFAVETGRTKDFHAEIEALSGSLSFFFRLFHPGAALVVKLHFSSEALVPVPVPGPIRYGPVAFSPCPDPDDA